MKYYVEFTKIGYLIRVDISGFHTKVTVSRNFLSVSTEENCWYDGIPAEWLDLTVDDLIARLYYMEND